MSRPLIIGSDITASDQKELAERLGMIADWITDKEWVTVSEVCAAMHELHPNIGWPETSVSAQLRNLRKWGWTVQRRWVRGHTRHSEYRAHAPQEAQAPHQEELFPQEAAR